MNIFSEEILQIMDINVGDRVTISFNVKGFQTDINGVNSIDASDIELENHEQQKKDSLDTLKRAMDRASLAHDPTRSPIPSP